MLNQKTVEKTMERAGIVVNFIVKDEAPRKLLMVTRKYIDDPTIFNKKNLYQAINDAHAFAYSQAMEANDSVSFASLAAVNTAIAIYESDVSFLERANDAMMSAINEIGD
jgi:hypothetical protein